MTLNARIQKGCKIAGSIISATVDPEERDFLNTVITPALLGSAWHDAFIEDSTDMPNDLMYRVVELPRLDVRKENRQDLADKVWKVGSMHVESIGADQPFSSSEVALDHWVVDRTRTRRAFRALTSASLWLGAEETARQVEAGRLGNPELIQNHVRESGYNMTRRALALAQKIGVLPTVEQLNDGYSPLTVELMRKGPSHLRGAYGEATAA